MVYVNYSSSNNAQSTISWGIGAWALSVIIKTWEWDLFPSTFPVLLTIEHYDTIWLNQVVTKREIVSMTNRVGDVCTITRWAGTCVQDDRADPKVQWNTALSFEDGDVISNYATAEEWEDMKDAIRDFKPWYDAVVDAWWLGDYTTIDAAFTAWKTQLLIMAWSYTMTDQVVLTDVNLVMHWLWDVQVTIAKSATNEIFKVEISALPAKWKIFVDFKNISFTVTNSLSSTIMFCRVNGGTAPSYLETQLVSCNMTWCRVDIQATVATVFYMRYKFWGDSMLECNTTTSEFTIWDSDAAVNVMMNTANLGDPWKNATRTSCLFLVDCAVAGTHTARFSNNSHNNLIGCSIDIRWWITDSKWYLYNGWTMTNCFGFMNNCRLENNRWMINCDFTLNDIAGYNESTFPYGARIDTWAGSQAYTTDKILYTTWWLYICLTNFTSDSSYFTDYIAWRIEQFYSACHLNTDSGGFARDCKFDVNNSSAVTIIEWIEEWVAIKYYRSWSVSWCLFNWGREMYIVWNRVKFNDNSITWSIALSTVYNLTVNNNYCLIVGNNLSTHYSASGTPAATFAPWGDYNQFLGNTRLDDRVTPSYTPIWAPTGNTNVNNIFLEI